MLFEILGNDSLIKEDSREKNKEEDLECDLLSKFRDLSLENKLWITHKKLKWDKFMVFWYDFQSWMAHVSRVSSCLKMHAPDYVWHR